MTYGSNECVNVRFKVEQFVTVVVIKLDEDHNPLADWVIIATPGPGNLFAEEQRETTDENGIATFTLSPGNWVFSEEAPDDVDWWEPVSPADGVQEVDVTAPGPHTIRFKNRIKRGKGCIEVIKRDVPPDSDGGTDESFGLPDWTIQVVRADGSIAAEGQTDAFGRVAFSDLPFGPYTVREIMLPGWEPVTPTAYEVVLARSDESCQVVEFYNKQVERGFCIVGYKRDQNGLYGIPGWEIDAEPLGVNGVDPDPVFTDGTGKYRIDLPLDDYRIPGSSYEICEETRTGWTPVGPTCHTVTLPKYEGVCVVAPDFINRQTQRENGGDDVDDTPQPQPKQGHRKGKHDGGWNPHRGGHGGCSVVHTVRRGESLSSVGRHYGVSVQALIRANPWVRQQRNLWLYTGQRLCIPG